MAKSRVINTKFWDDNYTSDLDPIEKLLFLYLLTNTSTNIAGVYEIPLKKIAMETGIDKDMVLKILARFENDKKVFFVDGWIWIKNFIKNQNERSPKVKKGIEVALEAVPSQIREKVEEKLKGMDTLSHLNSNSNSNLNLNSNINSNSNLVADDKSSAGIVQVLEIFKELSPSLSYGNKTQRKAAEEMIAMYGLEETLGMCRVVIAVQGLAYAPRASTPYAMWQKIGDFKSYFEAEKSKSKNNVAEV